MRLRKTTRFLTIDILCKWEKSAKPIDLILDQVLRNTRFADPRDRDMVFAMVYGTIRWRGYLDWILAKFSRHSLQKMKNRTLQALRVGLFQIIFMDRVPNSAAIDETIEALKAAKQPKWLTGFANGLLRTIARKKKELQDPRYDEEDLPDIARLSHPEWLLDRWRKRYGRKQTTNICMLNNTSPPLFLRVNTRMTTVEELLSRLTEAKISAQPGSFAPEAIRLSNYKGLIQDLPGYKGGSFQVQNEAAQLISLLLQPLLPGRVYLDSCAGLGGKASHLAQMLPNIIPQERIRPIVAVEPSKTRLRQLKENLKRLKLASRVEVIHDKLENLQRKDASLFAGVLMDVPCSGLGVIRRHPDIRWNRTPGDLLRYQKIQLALLESAACLVALGGVLVYATCSMEPEENDEVVARFCAEHHDFALTPCSDYLPPAAAGLVDEFGYFRTIPDKEGLDGFFAARLTKKI